MLLSDPQPPPKERSMVVALLKQLAIALLVGAVVLAVYLAANNSSSEDKLVGKYAYISRKGDYVGVIKGHGRSSRGGNDVYFIKQPTGELIEMSVQYIEVRDKPP